MLTIMKCDITITSRKDILIKLIIFSMSLLLREGEYRERIKKHNGLNLTKPIQKLFNDEKFRAEFTHTLAR